MLPTSIRSTSSSSSAPSSPPTGSNLWRPPIRIPARLGRPSVRWIPWGLAFVFSIWVFGSFISHLGHPPPPFPVFDGGPERALAHDHYRTRYPLRPHPPTIWSERADQVRNAFIHAYGSYKELAFEYDELLPLSGGKVNNFNGWGVTLIDSLDTLWIMDLRTEFQEVMGTIAKADFKLKPNSYAPFFETVIRYLGGLLSAYALSGEPILLSRADDLGRMLLPALNTPSGFPMYAVNTVTGNTRSGWTGGVLWAEALSCQLEYKYLAHLTGRSHYYHQVENIMTKMYTANITNGIFPTMWDVASGEPTNKQFSVGAFADSAHEYLLKQWLLTGRSEPNTRDLYLRSVSAIIDNLLFISPTRHLLYVTDTISGHPSQRFEHLSCFLPGLIALGVHTLDLPPKEKELHQWAAEGLAYTCWTTYADQATGLGPDEVLMDHWPANETMGGNWTVHLAKWEEEGRPGGIPPGLREVPREGTSANRDYRAVKTTYLLRPEALESFYILWQTTGDERWRERGWTVFQSIEKYTRTEHGYASILNVDATDSRKKDEMPSYFLAETLKYLFLLFTDEELIPLDNWVFNTEAHPLPIFDWADWEKEEYDLQS